MLLLVACNPSNGCAIAGKPSSYASPSPNATWRSNLKQFQWMLSNHSALRVGDVYGMCTVQRTGKRRILGLSHCIHAQWNERYVSIQSASFIYGWAAYNVYIQLWFWKAMHIYRIRARNALSIKYLIMMCSPPPWYCTSHFSQVHAPSTSRSSSYMGFACLCRVRLPYTNIPCCL